MNARIKAVPGALLVVSMLLSGTQVAGTALAARQAPLTQPSTVVYWSDFGHSGVNGWHSTVDSVFSVSADGILSLSAGELLAPLSVAHLRDFRVDAEIEATGQADQGVGAYGLDARAGTEAAGMRGGSFAGGPWAGQKLAWHDQFASGNTATLSPGYNAFALVVHGSDYRLWINGIRIVRFHITVKNAGARVGIWTADRTILIKSFTVTRLGVAPTLSAMPALQSMCLRPSEIPRSWRAESGNYLTAEKLAASGDPSLWSDATLSYWTIYGQAATLPSLPESGGIEINAYTTPKAAERALAGAVPGPSSQGPDDANWAVSKLTGLGDEAHVLSYTWVPSSVAIVWVYFRQGAYVVLFEATFAEHGLSQGQMVHQMTALARLVDRHIKSVG